MASASERITPTPSPQGPCADLKHPLAGVARVPELDLPEALGSKESRERVLSPRKDSDPGTTDPSLSGRGSTPHVHLTQIEAYFLDLHCLPTSFP